VTDGRRKTKQMHSEERSWKPSLLAAIMVPKSSQWRMMSYGYVGRIQPNSKVKEVRNGYERGHCGSKGERMVSKSRQESLK